MNRGEAMKCYECGKGEYRERHEAKFRVDDDEIGTFYVVDVSYMQCSHCGDRLIGSDDARKIEEARDKELDGILQSMPFGGFVSAAVAAKMLGISRQALHKHRRISRGFIYQTVQDGGRFYLKQSVEQFVKLGDGRFTLRLPEEKPVVYEETSSVTAPFPLGYFMRQTRMSDTTGTAAVGMSVISKQNTEEDPYADLKEQ